LVNAPSNGTYVIQTIFGVGDEVSFYPGPVHWHHSNFHVVVIWGPKSESSHVAADLVVLEPVDELVEIENLQGRWPTIDRRPWYFFVADLRAVTGHKDPTLAQSEHF